MHVAMPALGHDMIGMQIAGLLATPPTPTASHRYLTLELAEFINMERLPASLRSMFAPLAHVLISLSVACISEHALLMYLFGRIPAALSRTMLLPSTARKGRHECLAAVRTRPLVCDQEIGRWPAFL
jgi:hypothetical protein